MAIGRTNAAGGAKINGGEELLKVAPGQTINKGDFVSKSFDVSVGDLYLIDTVSNTDSQRTTSPSCSSYGNRLFTCIKYSVGSSNYTIRIDAFDVGTNKQFTPVATGYVILTEYYRIVGSLSIYALSSTRILLVYTKSYSSQQVESKILEISGTSFTEIAAHTLASSGNSFSGSYTIPGVLTRISDNRFVLKFHTYYQEEGYGGYRYYYTVLHLVTISESSVTISPALSFDGSSGIIIRAADDQAILATGYTRTFFDITGTTMKKGVVVTGNVANGVAPRTSSYMDGFGCNIETTLSDSTNPLKIGFANYYKGGVDFISDPTSISLIFGETSSCVQLAKNDIVFVVPEAPSVSIVPLSIRVHARNELKKTQITNLAATFSIPGQARVLTNGLLTITAWTGDKYQAVAIDIKELVSPVHMGSYIYGVALSAGIDGQTIRVSAP